MSKRSKIIHLFVSKQSVNHLPGASCLPVPLTSSLESHRRWVLQAALRTSTHIASFKVKATFTRSWASTGCLSVHLNLGVQIRGEEMGVSDQTYTHKEKIKECCHRYGLFDKWLSDLQSVVLCGLALVCGRWIAWCSGYQGEEVKHQIKNFFVILLSVSVYVFVFDSVYLRCLTSIFQWGFSQFGTVWLFHYILLVTLSSASAFTLYTYNYAHVCALFV